MIAPFMSNPHTAKAYDYLRKRILSGELPPGGFLSAQSLSKDIGVSRTPVREALRQLEYDELVSIVPRLGATVKKLNADQFEDLVGYRQALETYAAGRAAELRRPEEVEHLQEILDRLGEQSEALMLDPRDEELNRLGAADDIRFHRALFGMARNNLVRERFERAHILQLLLNPSLDFVSTDDEVLRENTNAVQVEHVRIFEAIRDGDAQRARDAMANHLRKFALKLFKKIRSTPDESLELVPAVL